MRILVIVPPERLDFYNYLENDTTNDYLLLWHETKEELKEARPSIPDLFKETYYWSRFATATALIKKIRPDKIIFFEIIDQRQIALIICAGEKKITTFYLEHGAAGSREAAIERFQIQGFVNKQRFPYLLKRIGTSLFKVVQSKFFFYSNLKGFNSLKSRFKYYLLPFVMLRHTPNKTLHTFIFRERVPKFSIVFNKVNFEEYQLITGIGEDEALFTGLPFYDKYFLSPGHTNGDHIVYIEHPYLEEKLLNWNEEHHRFIAQSLQQFANTNKQLVYIKLHPRSDMSRWIKWNIEGEFVKIIKQGDFTDLYLSSKLILGYSSSLINGFLCARKNIVLLGWHPEPRIFGNNFSDTGLCHSSLSPDDLETKFEYWVTHNQAENEPDKYNRYLKDYNYPFDGKATERVLKVIQDL